MAVVRHTTDPAVYKELVELNERVKMLNQRLTGDREINLLRVIKDLVWLVEKWSGSLNATGGSALENGQKALRGEY